MRAALITICFSNYILEKGFIVMNITSEEQDVDGREEHCFVAEFKAFPSGRCAWIHHSKPSNCDVITEDNGRRYTLKSYKGCGWWASRNIILIIKMHYISR